MSTESTSNGDADTYPLNRDYLASARLHLQQQIWTASLGYLLYPSIPLKDNTLIADVGCGTGIWSLEVARQLAPGSKIEAYDLSLAQCPPREWWPENVTFNELDIFEPIPEQLVGRYDVVYLRLFVCVTQSRDPIELLRALLKLLKPGGYLQWQEWDIHSNKLVVAGSTDQSSAEQIAPKLKAYMDGIRGPEALQAQTNWIGSFHTRFAEADAELIAHEQHWTALEARMMKQEIMFMFADEWSKNHRAKDPASPEAVRLEKLGGEAYEECVRLKRGSLIDNQMVTWVAKKP